MSDYRDIMINEMHARSAALEAERDALAALAEWMVGDHNAPTDCYSTGPMTGTPKDDLCPACAAIRLLRSGQGGRAILDARDKRMRRAGELEALQKLPLSKPYPRLCEYPDEKRAEANAFVDGWNAYSGVVGKAIAAQKKEVEG